MDDRLVCADNNHVPGCEHFTVPIEAIEAATGVAILPPEPDPLPAHQQRVAEALAAGLSIRVDVQVTRVGRKRCPRCRMLRVLFAQTAFSADQPVGYGIAMCGQCAGFRR